MLPPEQMRVFLSRIFPSDSEYPAAWRNIHWQSWPAKSWHGRAFKTLGGLIGGSTWMLTLPDANCYACMSLQAESNGPSKTGYNQEHAARAKHHALALKTLWLDLDYKNYASDVDAVRSMADWMQAIGMPSPTMTVATGGGLHAYWVFDRLVPVNEWLPLAEAFKRSTVGHFNNKLDRMLIADASRVLRLPGSINHKYPHKPMVELKGKLRGDHKVEDIRKILQPYLSITPESYPGRANGVASTLAPNPSVISGGNQIDTSEWSAGATPRATPVRLDEVFSECAVFNQAHAEAGATYGNELWHLIVLASTFTEDGQAWAHKLSSGWSGYDPAEVDAKYAEKLVARERNSRLGWPLCSQFSSLHPACQTCTHVSEGKSPLHFGRANNDLPPRYYRADGLVYHRSTNADGEDVQRLVLPVGLVGGMLDRHVTDGLRLHFTIVTRRGDQHQVTMPVRVINGMELSGYLGAYVAIDTTEVKIVRSFFVAWVNHLQNMTSTDAKPHPYGWNLGLDGEIAGFALNGKLYNGLAVQQTAQADASVVAKYMPRGTLQGWQEAANFITSQNRHDLNAIIASALAAPLVKLDGHQGLVMSAWSPDSGVGKSSALQVAQTFWGDVRQMSGLRDTENSVMHKIGILRSLPQNWDELKTDDQLKQFASVVFTVSAGREKSRLTSSVNIRQSGEWETMLICCNNQSLIEHIIRETEATDAGAMRVFEYEVLKMKNVTVSPGAAHQILSGVNSHFGCAGLIYGQYLGKSHAAVQDMLRRVKTALEAQVGAEPHERFWLSTMTTLLVGASLGNKLGLTQFDVRGLKEFLIAALHDLRIRRRNTSVNMSDTVHLEDLLAQFMTSLGQRHLLVTDHIPQGYGRPSKGFAVSPIVDTSKLVAVKAQLAVEDGLLRFTDAALRDWCVRTNRSAHTLRDGFKRVYGARVNAMSLGAMTPWAAPGKAYCIEIDLKQPATVGLLDGFVQKDPP